MTQGEGLWVNQFTGGIGRYAIGRFHATSSAGGEITWKDADNTAIALIDGDRIVVLSGSIVVTVGGDAGVYFDYDGDQAHDEGESFMRLTAAANGGDRANAWPVGFVGSKIDANKGKVRCFCASGTIDVHLIGVIMSVIPGN